MPPPRPPAGIAVTATALLLAGCASSPESVTTESAPAALGEVTMQLPWILNSQFIGEYLAVDEGYFAEAGLEGVNLVPGPSSGVSEVLSGSADLAMTDAMTVGTIVANEDAPLKIIASTYQKNPYSILSLDTDEAIRTPEDLIGKKIGVQDVNMLLFNALLTANDISPEEVEIVPVGYDPSPLILGEVDGYMSFLTNESVLVRAEGHEAVDMAFADNGLPFVADAIIATDEMIASNREALKAYLGVAVHGY